MVIQSESLSNNGCCVESVNGQTGVVVLTTTNVEEGTNQYFTNARARGAIDATTPILYSNVTGEIEHAPSGVTPGTYGGPSAFPVITVNEFGHITSVSEQSVSGGGGGTTVGPDLAAIEALTGTGYLIRTAVNTWALRSLSAASGRIALTEPDGVAGPTIIDLAYSGVVPGAYGNTVSYPKITVDSYGRITAISTQSIPTPTLPPHTHTLGNLSNVDNDVDSTAQLDQVITWTGSEYQAEYAKNKFNDFEITPAADWKIATGNGDVHTPTLNGSINLVRVETGVADRKLVSIHAVLYGLASIMEVAPRGTTHPTYTSLTSSRYTPKLIGTIPIEARPIHNLDIALPAYIESTNYWNEDHTAQFAEDQAVVNLNLHINTLGELWLSCVLIPDLIANLPLMDETGEELAYMIAPIVVTYPTDTIVD